MKTKSFYRNKLTIIISISLLAVFLGAIPVFSQNIIYGNPSNYENLVNQLGPGDTLLLEAGSYYQLYISNLNGEQGNPIVITGPETGPRAIILGDSGTNTVEIHNSSYLEIRNLEVDCRNRGGDGINTKTVTHHITLENLYIHGFSDHQQTVGISSNHAPSWNWIIRNNVITDGGTGIYLGDSNGREQFINGLIENNLIYDTIGYNMEIKHQAPRPDIPGIPTGKSVTVIRNNVFSKAKNSSGGSMARPNLLVGHFPSTGPGKDDEYHIYGNFFYQNPNEPLFQGEGNVAFYNNLLVNTLSSGYSEVFVQPHYGVPKMVRIFNNTIVSVNSGIHVSGGDPAYKQKVIGNAIFSTGTGISAADTADNVVFSYANAGTYLNNPFGNPGAGLDLYPISGMLTGDLIDSSSFNTFTAWNTDFNGDLHDGTFRGAYAGEGNNTGWVLQLAKKPMVFDTTNPTTPENLSATAQNASQISLTWNSSTDPETGIVYYKIYRNDSFIGQSTSTSYSDTGLNDSNTYFYEVSAVNGMGLESDRSIPDSATTLADTIAPTIIFVSSIGDPNEVTIIFSEPVEKASAMTVTNYQINNGISISGASLGADQKTITLTTSSHSEGTNYSLTVNNIKDRASVPNTIHTDTRKSYSFVAALLITNLTVASGKTYVWDALDEGKLPYIDRSFTFSTIPPEYVGLNYLRTANDDKSSSDNSFITFDVNQSVTVYVAHSIHITPKPSWLASWTDTSEELVTSDTTLRLYKKDYSAGTVTLGGNAGGNLSMYSVTIKSSSGTIDTTTPSPPTGLRKAN